MATMPATMPTTDESAIHFPEEKNSGASKNWRSDFKMDPLG
jgi:hypothetical protein